MTKTKAIKEAYAHVKDFSTFDSIHNVIWEYKPAPYTNKNELREETKKRRIIHALVLMGADNLPINIEEYATYSYGMSVYDAVTSFCEDYGLGGK